MFSVSDLCSSFWGIINIAYNDPRDNMLPRTLPIGTSSFGKSKSTVRPIRFNLSSMYSAYSLKI